MPFCWHLNPLCVCRYLKLSCGKSSASVALIPEKQTTDFSVSFWDYLDSCSTWDISVQFEVYVHMLKCQKMSGQTTQRSLTSLLRGKQRLNNTNTALLTRMRAACWSAVWQHCIEAVRLRHIKKGCRTHTVSAGKVNAGSTVFIMFLISKKMYQPLDTIITAYCRLWFEMDHCCFFIRHFFKHCNRVSSVFLINVIMR